MPVERPQLVNGEIYHVIIRGVGDSLIFKDENDYYRGIFSIYEFNTSNLITIRERRKIRLESKKVNRGQTPDTRDLFVEILAFCFMPNHIHLLLKQRKDNGVSNFMQKLGTGYATYFNKKYNRKGHLFNRFKSIHIKTNSQLQNVFVYIHTNPVFLMEPNWKEKGVENSDKVIEFLENYKWSSYQDYIGKKGFASVTKRGFMLEIMNGEKGCKEVVEDWIKYKKEMKDIDDIILE